MRVLTVGTSSAKLDMANLDQASSDEWSTTLGCNKIDAFHDALS